MGSHLLNMMFRALLVLAFVSVGVMPIIVDSGIGHTHSRRCSEPLQSVFADILTRVFRPHAPYAHRPSTRPCTLDFVFGRERANADVGSREEENGVQAQRAQVARRRHFR